MSDSPALKSAVLWYLGVTVAIVAQFVSNLGSILQKKSHNLEDSQPQHLRKPYTSRPLWWIGMCMVLAGSVADFVALTLAPQSIVATVGCLTLVAQVLWAPLILGEQFTSRHYLSTAIILAGVVAAVVFGPHSDVHQDAPQLMARFATLAFGLYTAAVVLVAASLFGAIQYVEYKFDLPMKPMLSDYLDDRTLHFHHGLGRFHRVAYGILSGVVGGQVVLLGKFIGEFVSLCIRGQTTILKSPALYLILVVLVICVVLQIRFLNSGVQKFQSLYVLPVFQATWTLTSVIGGLVVFDEWSSINGTAYRPIVFIVGILATLFGVYYLMQSPALPEDKEKAASVLKKISEAGKSSSWRCNCWKAGNDQATIATEKLEGPASDTDKEAEASVRRRGQAGRSGSLSWSRSCDGFMQESGEDNRDHDFHPGDRHRANYVGVVEESSTRVCSFQ